MTHRVIAVVDKQPEVTVVWHVQTDPHAPSAAGVLSGAWVLGEGEVDPARLPDLLRNAHVIHTDSDALSRIRANIDAELAGIKAAAAAAKKAQPSLTLPRFEGPEEADVDKLAEAYHGAPEGRVAWAYATAVAELVEAWGQIESQRRSRKYLQEEFGAEPRPVPLGE